MPTARVRRPAPATIGADLRPVREIRVGDRLPVDPSAHRLRPSVVVDMPGDGPQWCALVTVTDVEHTDAPTVHLHVDRIAYPRSRTCPPCPPLSSPAFFGPGSYWSYATSWLFNQAS